MDWKLSSPAVSPIDDNVMQRPSGSTFTALAPLPAGHLHEVMGDGRYMTIEIPSKNLLDDFTGRNGRKPLILRIEVHRKIGASAHEGEREGSSPFGTAESFHYALPTMKRSSKDTPSRHVFGDRLNIDEDIVILAACDAIPGREGPGGEQVLVRETMIGQAGATAYYRFSEYIPWKLSQRDTKVATFLRRIGMDKQPSPVALTLPALKRALRINMPCLEG